ncbi:MAG: aminotransferase class IV [Corynebacterium sp.]|nr:aminotransferase class IV [Corynebacterium sp.]
MMIVVDSFRVQDGRMEGRDLHEQRTRKAAEQLGFVLPDSGLWDEALSQDGFPRISVSAERAWVDFRPLPQLHDTIRLHPEPVEDPRTHPHIKGPDIPVLGELRAAAMKDGYDDVILTKDGYVLETAHGNILWFEGDTLMAVDPQLPVFQGVTQQLLLQSRPHAFGRIRPEELLARPFWVVNSLHGIRRA